MLRIYFYGLTLEFSSVYDEFMPGGSFTCPVCALLGVCILFMPCKRSLPPRVCIVFNGKFAACSPQMGSRRLRIGHRVSCEVGSPVIYGYPYMVLVDIESGLQRLQRLQA